MFHLHSLKEPPPKRMRETINFTSEVEATISSQESQPPPIQRQGDYTGKRRWRGSRSINCVNATK